MLLYSDRSSKEYTLASPQIRKLNNIYNSNLALADEVTGLRMDVKKGLKAVEKATRELDKTKKTEEAGAWRKVENRSAESFRPLVMSNMESAIKKLDILG